MNGRFSFVVAFVVAGCGGGPPPLHPPPQVPISSDGRTAAPPPAPSTPDAPFRASAPEAGPPPVFVPPKIEEAKLKNGIRILFVERHELPIVSVRVVLKGGTSDVGGERPEVLSFMGAMLEQGTKKRSAIELSDAYEAIGASHGAGMSHDSGGASVKVLSAELDKALELLADVTLNPAFPEAEVERMKARWIGASQQQKSSPGALAQSALVSSVFGPGHPYGAPVILKEEQIKKITRPDVAKAYARVFTAGNAAICVAGDVTKDTLIPKLETAFGAWKGAAPGRQKIATPPPPKGDAPRLVLVDRPGAPQAQVLLAEPGVSMSAQDRIPLIVMNAILGGMFSSRINLNLREKHAYTYGARSTFVMRHGAGPFSAGGAIFAEKTAPAIHELFTEITGLIDHDVSDEELAGAKDSVKLQMPARFETVSAVSDALGELVVYDLPLDEYAKRPEKIDKVSAADVRKAAQTHLHPRQLRIIVVGDRKTLTGALETLHMGAPEVRDAYGDILK